MRSDKSQIAGSPRQKIIMAALVVIVLIILWQVIGMFRGSKTPTVTPTPASSANTGAAPANTPPNPMQTMPKAAEMAPPPLSEKEAALMQLQQETQAKYVAALNELQMLKIAREIAETNQAIMVAKLATVTAEKNIVNLLIPQAQVGPAQYAKNLGGPGGMPLPSNAPSPQATAAIIPEANYSVISVSLLQYRWNAILGYQGNLYNVHVGDILPPDSSTVIAISKTGVILERNGVKRKISLVPAI